MGLIHHLRVPLRGRLLRILSLLFAHLFCAYSLIALTLNSSMTSFIFDVTINPIFSGGIHWERLSWGPEPWDLRIAKPWIEDVQNEVVVATESIEVDNYNLLGLLTDDIGADEIRIRGGRVHLRERSHSYQPEVLEWNIAELFKPPGIDIDDGDPPAPIRINFPKISIDDLSVKVRMGIVDLHGVGLSLEGGSFGFDLASKKMRIGARQLSASSVHTHIFLRETQGLSPLEATQAVIKRQLDYPLSRVQIKDFWWLADQFGSRGFTTNAQERDHLSINAWVMDIIKGAPPHFRGRVDVNIRSLSPYVAPWKIDQKLRGEVHAQVDLHGPVDNLAGRHLSAEGQLFLPIVQSIRFQIDGDKHRDDTISLKHGRFWSVLGDLEAHGKYDLINKIGQTDIIFHEFTWAKVARLPPKWRSWENVTVGGAHLKLRPHSTLGWTLNLELDATLQGVYPLKITGRAEWLGEELKLYHLDADLAHIVPRFRARGAFNIKTKVFSLIGHAKARLSPDAIPPLKIPLSGYVELDFNSKGTLKSPQIKGTLKLLDTSGTLGKYPWKIKQAEAEFYLDLERVLFKHLKISTDQGGLTAQGEVPLKRPQEFSGWALLDHLYLDLSPLNLPLKGALRGVACTTQSEGCETYKRQHPLPSNEEQDSCFRGLYEREHPSKKGMELCLSAHKLIYQNATFKELAVNAQWRGDRLHIRRGRLWKSQRLLLDLEGLIDFKRSEIQTQLKLLDFPLQLIHLFLNQPPKFMKTLYGTVGGELRLNGPLKQPSGRGEIRLNRLSVKYPFNNITLPLKLGELKATFDTNDRAFSAQGHLGRFAWFDTYIPFGDEPLHLGLEFHHLGLSYLSTPARGVLGYQEEAKRLTQLKVSNPGVSPLSLTDPNIALTLLGIGDELYCKVSEIPFPLGHLLHATLQGRADLKWWLHRSFHPTLKLDIDRLKLEYWQRDLGGSVISIPARTQCSHRCGIISSSRTPSSTDSAQDKPNSNAFDCPTLELSSMDPIHIEAQSIREVFDAIYLNPQLQFSKTPPPRRVTADQSLDSQRPPPSQAEPRVKSRALDSNAGEQNPSDTAPQKFDLSLDSSNRCTRDGETTSVEGWRPNEWVSSSSVHLRGLNSLLKISGLMRDKELSGCIRGELDLSILTPFLKDIYQRFEGRMSLDLGVTGHASQPRLNGEVELIDIAMLSPRSQILGDLRFIKPLTLALSPLDQGGVSLSIAYQGAAYLRRDEGEVLLNQFSLTLPQFRFGTLSVHFSAPQMDFKLPQLGRATIQLREMRFDMVPLSAQSLNTSKEVTSHEMIMSGEVDVIRGRYTADVVGSGQIRQGLRNYIIGRSNVETLSIFERSPLLKRLKLDLKLKGDGDLYVTNQVGVLNLNLETTMNLKVRGFLYSLETDRPEDQLQLSGSIKTLDGSMISYMNKPFEVSSGFVRFGERLEGGSQVDSFMTAQIEATHTFRVPRSTNTTQVLRFDQNRNRDFIEEDVVLHAQLEMATKESAPQFELGLSSSSGASKIELATLVLTGRYPSDFNASTSTQPATEMLLSPILNMIERPIEESLDLKLTLSPDTSNSIFVDIQKAFSRRLSLSVKQLIGQEDLTQQNLFNLNYKINNLIYGEFTSEHLDLGQDIDFNFRLHLRYRWE